MIRRRLGVPLVALAALVATTLARAETLEELDARLEQELGKSHPEAVLAFHEGNTARKAGDHERAREAYGQAMKLAPAFAPATRRACQAELELDRRDDALPLCRKAADIEADSLNLVTLAMVLVSPPSAAADTIEAQALVKRAIDLAPRDPYILASACDVGLDANDFEVVQRAADGLESVGKGEARELVCRAVAALSRGRYDEAEQLSRAAEQAGASPEVGKRLGRVVREGRPPEERVFRAAILAVAGALAGFALSALAAVLVGARMRRRVRGGGSPPPGLVALSGFSLWAFALAYVVATPLLVAAAFAVLGVLVRHYAVTGNAPGTLVGTAVAFGVAALGVRKLFGARGADDDRGVRLERRDHAALHDLVDEAARKVGAPPFDAIVVSPGIAVRAFEKTSVAHRVIGPGERVVAIGAGGLVGLRVGELQAVLGRELAALRSGGGGALAFAVSSAARIGDPEAPSWWLSRVFRGVFEKASIGAREAQRRDATARAEKAFGAALVHRAERHFVKRTVRHRAHVEATLDETVQRGEALENLYAYEPKAAPDTRSEVTAALAEAGLDEPPAVAADAPEPDPGADAFAWTLFADREAVERALTKRVLARRAT